MVAWHPPGELLASCSYDNSIKLWVNDGDEWACTQTLGGETPAASGKLYQGALLHSAAQRWLLMACMPRAGGSVCVCPQS
jgi:hypothetical protein